KDVDERRLNIDVLQQEQAKKEHQAAETAAQGAVRECFRWLVCPVLDAPTDREPRFEAYPLNLKGTSFAAELDRVCGENELVIKVWSPVHLRNRLRELYWKDGRTSVRALAVWEDMQKFLYLPRLLNRAVYE